MLWQRSCVRYHSYHIQLIAVSGHFQAFSANTNCAKTWNAHLTHLIFRVSNPSPKHSVTLVPNPIKCIRTPGLTCLESAHSVDGLSIAYKTHLLRDATQPSGTSEQDSRVCGKTKRELQREAGTEIACLGWEKNTSHEQISAVLQRFAPRNGQDTPGKASGQPGSMKHCTGRAEHLTYTLTNSPSSAAHPCPGGSTVLSASFSWGLGSAFTLTLTLSFTT